MPKTITSRDITVTDSQKKHVRKKSASKIAYDLNYRRTKMLSIAFRLSYIYDADLIKTYQSIPNKADWFRQALRDYQKKAR